MESMKRREERNVEKNEVHTFFSTKVLAGCSDVSLWLWQTAVIVRGTILAR